MREIFHQFSRGNLDDVVALTFSISLDLPLSLYLPFLSRFRILVKMNVLYRYLLVLVALPFLAFGFCAAADPATNSAIDPTRDWPSFRGMTGTTSDRSDIQWELSNPEHLLWKAPLIGSGTSSPIVVGDRVFVTAYSGYGTSLTEPGKLEDLKHHVFCYDRATGDLRWKKDIASVGGEDRYLGFIMQHGYASSTPTSDGQRVYVLFGKTGLIAFDLDGNQLWQTDLGQQSDPMGWGSGSSPIVVDGVVLVNASIMGRQLVGVDAETGDIKWSVKNKGFTNAWSTPLVLPTESGKQAIFCVPKQILSFDVQTGKPIWDAAHQIADATCASIVSDGDIAILMGGRDGKAIAVRTKPDGDQPAGSIVWERPLRSSICSPLLLNGRILWPSNNIFMCIDAKTGEEIYKERMPRKDRSTGGFPNVDYSSPIAVGDKILLFARGGESYIIAGNESFELLRHNDPFPDDKSAFSATPAIAGQQVFIRSEKFLYAIGD